ncbi:MAG: phosphate signaling complex protein PhoU, partial [Elusimicrobiota bacterium]|jgi:phosphate transport system protein|nr:phosphate signaling complex protein PhoU [Elusimicrobiota bacterium]
MEFDKLCIICLARYQPVTKNLRTVVSVIKINGDLERISDHCVNIAQSAEFLIANPTGKSYEFLAEMAQKVMDMTQLTIKAFITEDCYLANKLMRGDDEIDKLQDQAIAKGIELMQKQNQLIPSVLRLINIAKNLERIADLNTNICEEIIYFSGGTVTKHHTIS